MIDGNKGWANWGRTSGSNWFVGLCGWINNKSKRKKNVSSSVSSVSRSVVFGSLQPRRLQHTRPPCPSPTPRACSNSCPSSQWCYPTDLTSVVPFSSCLQSFPASGFFPMSQFFPSGGQSIGVSTSASVLLKNIQDWLTLKIDLILV